MQAHTHTHTHTHRHTFTNAVIREALVPKWSLKFEEKLFKKVLPHHTLPSVIWFGGLRWFKLV